MSWLARSIANSLRLDEDDELVIDSNDRSIQSESSSGLNSDRGVKEDLSELTKTLTRQFWGVASFLAPPPYNQKSSTVSSSGIDAEDPESSDSVGVAGIRSDFAEIGGRVRSGISKLSNNINVSEIGKIASNFLQLGPDEDEDELAWTTVVGVTEEVVEFVRDIARHPDTWLDFPLIHDAEDDDDEFDMSDIQQEHALAVERLTPRLAALRLDLCPGYMSEGLFWKIYFVLVHPKLNNHDADLLSTPQILKARALLLTPETKNKTNSELDSISLEPDKHPVQTTDIPIIDKSIIIEDDADDWLKEEGDGRTGIAPIQNEEDVSFSDLEEDEDIQTSYKKEKYGSDSSNKNSPDWVQLSRSSTASAKDMDCIKEVNLKESNDWLDIDEIYMD